MALFFLKSTAPHKLKDAPGGAAYLTQVACRTQTRQDGFRRTMRALPFEQTARDLRQAWIPAAAPAADYLNCWNKYWAWTKTDDFKTKMRAIASAPDFTDNNYMAAEFRVPVTLLQTNACSPLATNAIRDNIWDNFSSETYKQLPSVGEITDL